MKRYFFWALPLIGVLSLAQTWASALPFANLTITPAVGERGGVFEFDATGSRNAFGSSGLQYRFQFAPGESWTSFGTGKRRYRPKKTGTFRAKVQVKHRESGTTQTTYREYRVVEHLFRSATIKVLTPAVRAGDAATYEMKVALPRTEDPDKVKIRWDFDSDGKWDTRYSRQRIVHHVFSPFDVGQVSPTAEVIFPNGERRIVRGDLDIPESKKRRLLFLPDETRVKILPPRSVPPIVNVSPGKNGFSENTEFTFDASQSRVPKHGWIEWSFDAESFVRDKEIVKKRFNSPGKHLIRTRTCFNRQSPVCEETRTTIYVKEDPRDFILSINIHGNYQNRIRRYSGDNVVRFQEGTHVQFYARTHFSGGNSEPPGMTFRWDFEGDGIWDTPFSRQHSARHTYPREGEFFPRVQAQSRDDLFATTQARVIIQRNTPPSIIFDVPQEVYVGETVRFHAKVSDHEDNRNYNLKVRFDMDGDGLWDSRFGTSRGHSWVFDEPGIYTARMEVKDSGKAVTSLRRTFQVKLPEPPAARATVSRKTGFTQTIFAFDAVRSGGRGLRYLWYFDVTGRSTHEKPLREPSFVGAQVKKQFLTPGRKLVLLRVEDRQGRADQIVFPVFVYDELDVLMKEQSTLQPIASHPVNPSDTLTRGEMVALIYQARRGIPPYPGRSPFLDVNRDDFFFEAARQAFAEGVVKGSYFHPFSPASSQEAQLLVHKWLGKKVYFGQGALTRETLRKAL